MENGASHIRTPSSDTIVDTFTSIRDVLKDSNHYFQNHIDVHRDDTRTCADYDHLECLYERTTNALTLVDNITQQLCMGDFQRIFGCSQNENHGVGEQIENTSYLDMSRKKYESIDLTENHTVHLNRHDYVDVGCKPAKEFNGDDNIYDNYVVERNHTAKATDKVTMIQNRMVVDSTKEDIMAGRQKSDCPFTGLPAAHLKIMHSPKVGWLMMHLRGKRYIHHFGVHFKRKYYTGLVMKQSENAHCEWWLLMYAGGANDLKPSVCLPLNCFTVHANHLTDAKEGRRQECENRINPCKFELNEKSNRKSNKSYCFVADTPEHCEHWVNLLKQLSIGLPYVESTFLMTAQIRKLPMLPSNAKSIENGRQPPIAGTDTIDKNDVSNSRSTVQNDRSSDDVCNPSEGVYEEPEDYYKIVQNYSTTAAKMPVLPQKKLSIRPGNVTAAIYDTPKKPIRRSDEHYDQISLENSDTMTLESGNLNENDEICTQLSSIKQNNQPRKYASPSDRMANSNVEIMEPESPVNKYHMSTVRKWLFSNHFSKLRQSSNSTNSERTSCDDGTAAEAVSSPSSQNSQRNKTVAIVLPTDGQRRTFSAQPKFNKVHMIINQLEANGQLTLISGGTTTKV